MSEGVRNCIYCEASGKLTNEHVFGDWTRKYVPRPRNKHDFRAVVATTPTQETGGPVRIRAGDPLNSQIKVVCKPCNNGWMGQIQETAKPYLIPLFEGRKVSLGQQAQRWIATWATMATMTGEYISRDLQNIAVPQIERTQFKQTSRPPKNWRIWIGNYDRQEWVGQWRHNSIPIYPASEIMEKAASGKRLPNHQTTSFVIGKLFVHVFSGHFRGIVMRWDWQNAPNGLSCLSQIWPIARPAVPFPPAVTMTDADAQSFATAFIRRSAEIASKAGYYPFGSGA